MVTSSSGDTGDGVGGAPGEGGPPTQPFPVADRPAASRSPAPNPSAPNPSPTMVTIDAPASGLPEVADLASVLGAPSPATRKKPAARGAGAGNRTAKGGKVAKGGKGGKGGKVAKASQGSQGSQEVKRSRKAAGGRKAVTSASPATMGPSPGLPPGPFSAEAVMVGTAAGTPGQAGGQAGGPTAVGGRGASRRAPRRPEKLPPRWQERLFGPVDILGWKVRVGLVWAVFAAGALYEGIPYLGALLGLVAGVAALQTARDWRRVGSQPNRLVALLGAAGMPIAAIWGVGLCGLVCFAIPILALVATVFRRRHRTPMLAAAGATIRSSLFAGIAAATPVLVYRTSVISAILLIVYISAYDMGSFLVGSEASGPMWGPIAGMIVTAISILPVAVAVEILEVPPFSSARDALIFGGLVGVLAPFGEIAASLVLPNAAAPAQALRRLDSLIVAGPAWLLLFWNYLGVS